MRHYLFTRALLAVLTVLIISWIGFGLAQMAPADPVLEKLELEGQLPSAGNATFDEDYRSTAIALGLDKPLFYGSLLPGSFPDTLHRLVVPRERALAEDLLGRYGHWPAISAYVHALDKLDRVMDARRSDFDLTSPWQAVDSIAYLLQQRYDPGLLVQLRSAYEAAGPSPSTLGRAIEGVLQRHDAMVAQARPRAALWPKLVWHGFDNQYHHWLLGYFRGDFGTSYDNGQPVAERVLTAWTWTLLLNGCAILLAYLISIPLGVWSATHRGQWLERLLARALFAAYAMPTFWIGSLCLILFTTNVYGMDWFPTLWQGTLPEGLSVWQRFWSRASFFVLPVLCLTYPALAFITSQVRGSMLQALGQDYIRTARAKGLPPRLVIWRHAFRNALFPLITLMASILPELFAGSVVIEVIFNIPGMGRLTVDALLSGDWPVVYAILIVGACLTILGLLLADVLYFAADPRVSFRSRSSSN